MKCPYPLLIKNPKFELQSGQDPFISVPCGKCEVCRHNDAIRWRVRLIEEYNACFNCFFVTLTYRPDALPVDYGTSFDGSTFVYSPVCKEDVQKFLKRFRTYWKRKKGSDLAKFKYFCVSEYTPINRNPHYHFLFFNVDGVDATNQIEIARLWNEIEKIWNFGFVTVEVTTYGRIGYVTNYFFGLDNLPHGYTKPFRLMSRRPAIGIQYLDKKSMVDWHKENLNNYYPSKQWKLIMPRYYRDKIFNDDERKELTKKSAEYELEKILKIPYSRIKEYSQSESDELEQIRLDYLRHRNEEFRKHIRKRYDKSKKLK